MKKGFLFIILILIPALGFGSSPELALPSVPVELRQPHERAAYIIEHFWDAMNFEDTRLSRDYTFMEQNMVNWLSLFPHADAEALPLAVDKLLKRASVDKKALQLVLDLAEQYLYDPYSPMRDEEHYIIFLEARLRMPGLSDVDRLRPEAQLEDAMRSRVGNPAPDFTFEDRNGNQCSLYQLSAEPILLVFYSEDCNHCSELLDDLKDVKNIKIVTICAEAERTLWEQRKHTLPGNWTVGITSETDLYDIPSLPTLYYLSPNKTIERKTLTLD